MTKYGVDVMEINRSKKKRKQLSKGRRKHMRRMRQAARRAGIQNDQIKNRMLASEARRE